MTEITASGLANMTGNVADDGHAVIVGFKNRDGQEFQTSMNSETLTKCVGFLLGLAEETGKKIAPENRRTQQVTASPLPIAQIGVAKGRTQQEAVLAVQTGILRLVFSTEVGTIVGMCKDLTAHVVSEKPRPRN